MPFVTATRYCIVVFGCVYGIFNSVEECHIWASNNLPTGEYKIHLFYSK